MEACEGLLKHVAYFCDSRFSLRLPTVHVFYSSSRNTCDLSHEIRVQSEIWLHREYNLATSDNIPCPG